MRKRLAKKWLPRDEEGEVHHNVQFEDIDFSKGEWLVLTRTNKMLERLRDHLYRMNYRFEARAQEYLPNKMLSAYRVWKRLNEGAYVNKEDVKDLWDFLTVKDGHLERGFAGGKTLGDITSINLEGLKAEHGLRASGSWETLKFPEESKLYIKKLLESGDDLMKPARIKLSTIHAVKGEERDNVVLFTDIERIIYESAKRDADAEHRTFFVGITRAKEKLFITNQGYEYQYNIGAPII
tara:strand:- start:6 stop:719 length:714 start_codon:yes stop_codon:yes gene_type:complete